MGYREVRRQLKSIPSSGDPEKYLISVYGDAGARALKTVKKGRVIKVVASDGEVWMVRGRTRDYLVIPQLYCSCRGFTFLVARGVAKPCYHLIAQAYAEKTGEYRTIRVGETCYEVVARLLL